MNGNRVTEIHNYMVVSEIGDKTGGDMAREHLYDTIKVTQKYTQRKKLSTP
jgi:hypothetical protein